MELACQRWSLHSMEKGLEIHCIEITGFLSYSIVENRLIPESQDLKTETPIRHWKRMLIFKKILGLGDFSEYSTKLRIHSKSKSDHKKIKFHRLQNIESQEVPIVAQRVMNLTGIHEDAGLIPGIA